MKPFLEIYTNLGKLGKGSFATVYKVRHNELDYVRAVRVLDGTVSDEASDTYQNFLKECRKLLCLGNGNHPYIVHIYQPLLKSNQALVEMDYVDGKNVAQHLEQNQNFVSVVDVIRMATQISSALAYCHEDIYRFRMDKTLDKLSDDPNYGDRVIINDAKRQELIKKYRVLHNDIHAGNIMRRENGNFILLDFGLSIEGEELVLSNNRKSGGAPEYKPPEKWDKKKLTEQSDIYSFGIVLYQYLAGRVPFPYNKSLTSDQAGGELAMAHRKGELPDIETLRKEFYEKIHKGQTYAKDYPQWLEDVIKKCLQVRPENRFKNGKELYNCILQNIKNEDYYQKEYNRLNDETHQLNRDLSLEKKANQALQSQLSQTQGDLDHLSGQHKKLQTELSTKRKRIGLLVALLLIVVLAGTFTGWQLYNQIAPLNAIVVEKTKTVKSLSDTIVEKDRQLQAKDQEIEQLKKVKTSGDNFAEIKQLNETIASQRQQVQDLQNQLTKKQNEVANLNAQLANAKKTSTGKGTNNSADVTRLQKQIDQKEKDISELNNKLNTANNRILELTQLLADARNKITSLEKAIEGYKK